MNRFIHSFIHFSGFSWFHWWSDQEKKILFKCGHWLTRYQHLPIIFNNLGVGIRDDHDAGACSPRKKESSAPETNWIKANTINLFIIFFIRCIALLLFTLILFEPWFGLVRQEEKKRATRIDSYEPTKIRAHQMPQSDSTHPKRTTRTNRGGWSRRRFVWSDRSLFACPRFILRPNQSVHFIIIWWRLVRFHFSISSSHSMRSSTRFERSYQRSKLRHIVAMFVGLSTSRLHLCRLHNQFGFGRFASLRFWLTAN